jgi:hypothetical protein
MFVISQISYFASSVNEVLGGSKNTSLPAYMSSVALHKKQETWFHELERSGVIADVKLIHSGTPYARSQLIVLELNIIMSSNASPFKAIAFMCCISTWMQHDHTQIY